MVVLSSGLVVAVGGDPEGHQTDEGVALQAFSVTGEVDSSFGEAGLARSPIAGDAVAHAHPDGGLVLAGLTRTGASVIVKLRHDGQADSSFGENGVVQTGASSIDALVVRPDGRVVFLVPTDVGTSFALVG